MAEPQPLFARLDLHDYLRHRRTAMKQEIQQLDLTTLADTAPAWRQALQQKYHLAPLQLGTDIHPVEITDTFLNLRGLPGGALWGNPSRVPAHRIVYTIPFQGHHELFHCTPSTQCGTASMFIVTATELRAVICVPTNKDAIEIRRQLDRELDYVRKHILWMADDIQRYNTATPSFIDRCIADRQKALTEKAAFHTALGLKVPAPASRAEASAKAESRAEASAKADAQNGRALLPQRFPAESEPGRALLPQRFPSPKPSEDRAETSAKADAQNGSALLPQRPPSDLRPQSSELSPQPSDLRLPPCTPSDIGSSKLDVRSSGHVLK